MNKLKSLLFSIILIAMFACGGEDDIVNMTALPIPETSSDYNEANQKVDDFFASFIGEDTPGGAVTILKDGKPVYQAAYGLANLEEQTPLTTNHIFHIASMGKQMTAFGIMMLADDGKLDFDDTVGTHVPELEHFGEDFTIRRLLTHTSGLQDYDSELEDALFAISAQPTNDDLLTVLSEMQGPAATPGDEFEYSNPGYELLATVIERVSGQKFPDFMQTRIFDPLGMTHTFSLPNENRRADPMVAMSYTGENGQPEAYPSDDLDNLYGSGSIYTTLGDMALYDEMLYTNQLVSQATLQQAFTPVQLNDGSIEPYGFGWELEEWNGESYVAHSGAWLGFNSDYVRFPSRHFSVIVLLNRDYDYPDDPRIALQIAVYYLQ
jgi:CubicO group peptidase (beta-lactamase class C family)